jgi:hypothetical protein
VLYLIVCCPRNLQRPRFLLLRTYGVK